MIDLAFWATVGTLIGLLYGIVPGLGPFIAVATFYPFLLSVSPASIMMYYVSILIATNYANSVTAIIYGVPGDATAIPTAKIGHKFFLKGYGSLAVSSAAISSTVGVIFSVLLFIVGLPVIISFFSFYNSIIQTIVISFSILLITLFTNQNKIITVLLFLFGVFLSHIGIDTVTFESFATFGNGYLSLGIPFSAIMVGLYMVPEIFKIQLLSVTEPKKISKFGVGKGILFPSLVGSFIGFWCGLIPGITNILGSYVSSSVVKRFSRLPNLKSITAAEAANNSGALSSLLPLLILAIPITGSEFLVYYLMIQNGFSFNVENTVTGLYNIIYFIPIVTAFCFFVSWYGFNLLGKVAYLYKRYKTWINPLLLTTVSIVNILIFPIHEWMLMCLLVLMVLGYALRRLDTSPIIYGYFLGDLLYQSLVRTLIILS